MALIKCTKCGQMISDRAKACPKCGEPVRSINETPNEYRPSGQSYSRPDSSINPTYKKKTSPALIATIALLSLAVLALGGIVLYKMIYEPSLLDQSPQEQEEVLIDMSGEDASGNNVVAEEQTEVVQEQLSATIEKPVDATTSQLYPNQFQLSGNMAGFPMTIKISLDNGYPGKCSGLYHNVKYKTNMNLSGSFEDNQMYLVGYADGTSYTFNLMANSSGSFVGDCKIGNGKTLRVSLERE